MNLLVSLRPGQWTKNLFVFAGLVFGKRLLDPVAALQATAAFAIFCALSGVVYSAQRCRRPRDRCAAPFEAQASDRLRRPVRAHGAGGRSGDSHRRARGRVPARRPVPGLDAAAYVVLLALYSGGSSTSSFSTRSRSQSGSSFA